MGSRDPSEQVVAIVGMLHRLSIDVDDNFDPWQMRRNGSVELCLESGGRSRSGGVALLGWNDLDAVGELTPAMIFGN